MIKSRFDPKVFSGKIEYLFDSEPSDFFACELGSDVSVCLSLPLALGTLALSVSLLDKNLLPIGELSASWVKRERDYDIYAVNIGKFEKSGLYFLKIRLETFFGALYLYSFGQKAFFSFSEGGSLPQLTVSDFAFPLPQEYYGGIIYHIFVDRFMRGGKSSTHGDEVVISDWSKGVPEYPSYPGAPLKNNTFYGGTLYGIADKLDYIESLGANTIYLSPIFTAYSNHKYDTADYMSVDSMFGADEALEYLIKKADEKGIKIILDGVFNHTGADSIYFNRYGTYNSQGAYQSIESPYYPWYEFQSHPEKYTSWWGIEILPRINPDIKECREYFIGEGGVIEKYARMGIGGFRLDVCDELSDEFISLIKSKLCEHNKGSILYGEVWEDASNKIAYDKRKQYYLGCELDGVMNYPIRTGIIEYIVNRNKQPLDYALNVVLKNTPKRILDAQMNLLGTHDTERILTVLSGTTLSGIKNSDLVNKRLSPIEREIAKTRLKAAYTVLATLPGIPAVFYGDEAGLEGYNDPFNRMPYPWGDEDDEILSLYRKIGKLRRSCEIYKTGDFKLLHLSDDLLVFKREQGDECLITVYNNSSTNYCVIGDAGLVDLLVCDGAKEVSVTVKSGEAKVLKVSNIDKIIIKSILYNEAEK